MSTIKEDIMSYMSSQGLQPQDTDFGIYFKYQMLNFLIFWDEEDYLFLRICLPNIFDVDDDNRTDALEACNTVTYEMKVAKCFINDGSVWVATEQLLDSTPEFDDIIPRSLNILTQGRREFYSHMFE